MPYVVKGAREFGKTAGDVALERVKILLATLKARWTGDKEATKSLENFENKPAFETRLPIGGQVAAIPAERWS
jgi:hypothetical protein